MIMSFTTHYNKERAKCIQVLSGCACAWDRREALLSIKMALRHSLCTCAALSQARLQSRFQKRPFLRRLTAWGYWHFDEGVTARCCGVNCCFDRCPMCTDNRPDVGTKNDERQLAAGQVLLILDVLIRPD